MAKTTTDNLISNISYTEKDFQTIYPALLDLVKKETSKWDPSASNESDPGVLLLKLNAIIADKCNYNIDKNVLECFPVSVTQDRNARQLFEQLGYYMHWYQAANSSVVLKWIGNVSKDGNGNEIETVYEIPRFTMFSNTINETTNETTSDKSLVVYTSITPKSLSTNGSSTFIPVLQGIAKKYEINGVTNITTANLDSKNRLYFNEYNIAENGIFITNINANNYEMWQKKDNLLIEDLSPKNKIYKFGISQDLSTCYLEFPENAEEIFQDGINITYLVTDGTDGTIAPKELDAIYDTLVVKNPLADKNNTDTETIVLTTNDISISNFIASVGGDKPETIDDAYREYKKIVGTFNTLVTLRDYMNAIQRSEYTSNGIISDRTTDIQSSYNIMSQVSSIDQLVNQIDYSARYDKLGYYDGKDFYVDEGHQTLIDPDENYNYKCINKNGEFSGKYFRVIYTKNILNEDIYTYIECSPVKKPEMEAFDLKMYLLSASPILLDAIDFNNTFNLNIDSAVTDTVAAEIDGYDCVQHDFIDILPNKLCFIKNKYPINCKIIPQYALSETQRDNLLSNVQSALFKNLNASKIEFGQELDFEEIYNIILEADSRIKNIILDPISYTPYIVYLYKNPNELDPTIVTPELREVKISNWITKDSDGKKEIDWEEETNKFMKEIYAKSVLAGKTQFFIKDSSFDYGINQKYQLLESNIGRLDTNLSITLDQSNDWQYVVRENEVIQLYAPNLLEYTNYSSNVKIEYHLFKPISANAVHKLLPEEYVILYWMEDNAQAGYNYAVYGSGSIISPSFNMINSVELYNLIGNILLNKVKSTTVNGNTFLYASGDTETDQDLITNITSKIAVLTKSTNILSGTKKVSVLLQNSITIDNKYSCYWVLNETKDGEYILFDDSQGKSRILGNGECFIYTLNNDAEYTILGSGTEIIRNTVVANDKIACDATLAYDDIIEKGLTEITNKNAWKTIESTTLDINEMQYISFGEGCVVQIKPNADVQQYEFNEGAVYELRLKDDGNPIKQNSPYILNTASSEEIDDAEYLVTYEKFMDPTNYFQLEIKQNEWNVVDDLSSRFYGCYYKTFTTKTLDKHLEISEVKASYSDFYGFEINDKKIDNTVTIYFKFLNAPTSVRVVKLYCNRYKATIFGPGSVMLTDVGTPDLISTTTSLVSKDLIKQNIESINEYKYAEVFTEIDDPINKEIANIVTTLPGGLLTKSSRTINSISFDSSQPASLFGTTIKYKETADAVDWKTISQMQLFDEDYAWKVNTLLRLNTSADIPQKLYKNQSITCYKWDSTNERIITNTYKEEYSEEEWEKVKPRIIDPTQEPFEVPTFILTSIGIDDLGPKINMLRKADDGKYVTSQIYAYILDDNIEDDILFLADGTTQLVFRKSKDQIQTKKVTFKLPKGDYIMPLTHNTDNSMNNNEGINYLKVFLQRQVFTDVKNLTRYQFTFKSGKDMTSSFVGKDGSQIYLIDGQDEEKYGAGIWNVNFKSMPEKQLEAIPTVSTEYIVDKIKFEGSKTAISSLKYHIVNFNEYVEVYTSASGWLDTKYQNIQCIDNSFMESGLYYFNDDEINPAGWLVENIVMDSIEEELAPMSDAINNNMYKPGNYYLKINNLPDNFIDDDERGQGNFFVTVRVTIHYTNVQEKSKIPAVSILIPKIFKYNNTTWKLDSSNPEVNDALNADLFVNIYDEIKKLDFNHLYNYTYVVDEDVEIKNPLDGRAFLDPNHIMNQYTICQLDTSEEAYNILVTNVIRRTK